MSHLVRCRGGEWWLDGRLREWSGAAFFQITGDALPGRFYWNAVPTEPHPRWGTAPAWFPVAWLCCEADPIDGPKFAAAILDAEPGDDVPAIIACDHVEGTGVRGKGLLPIEEIPEDWERHLPEFAPEQVDRFCIGPLSSWCRRLIEARCVACGGRRPRPAEGLGLMPEGRIADPDRCPLCGSSDPSSPRPLAIPEVAR